MLKYYKIIFNTQIAQQAVWWSLRVNKLPYISCNPLYINKLLAVIFVI